MKVPQATDLTSFSCPSSVAEQDHLPVTLLPDQIETVPSKEAAANFILRGQNEIDRMLFSVRPFQFIGQFQSLSL